MKNKTFIALFTAFMAVALIMSGCSGFVGPDTTPGKGTLSLNIQGFGADARTILPTLTYEATFTAGTTEIKTTLYAGGNFLTLAPAAYTISVEAKNAGTVVGKGTGTVTITADAAASATITITPETGVGTAAKGNFKWDLSAADFSGTPSIKIYKLYFNTFNGPSYVPFGTKGTSFGNANSFAYITDITIPASTDLTGYTTLTFDIDAFANGTQVYPKGNNDNDLCYRIFSTDTDADVQLGGNEWNGAGSASPWTTWTIPTAAQTTFTKDGKLRIVAANKSNAVDVIQVKSIKFSGTGKTDIELISATYPGLTPGAEYKLPSIDADLKPADLVDTKTTLTGTVELASGNYYVIFEAGGVKWNEVLTVVGGLTSDYMPSFNSNFPATGDKLLDKVLEAFNAGKYAINADEFAPLELNITGSSAAKVNESIGIILKDTANPVPTTKDGLKELIDAALILASGTNVTVAVTSLTDTTAAETGLKALAKNGTDFTTNVPEFAWTGADDDKGVFEASVVITKIGASKYTVSLVASPSFYLDLPNQVTLPDGSSVDSGFNGGTAAAVTKNEDGSVILKYNSANNTQMGFFVMTAEQITKMKAASTLTVTINGSSTPDSAEFRACFGKVTTGSNWNDTSWVMNPDTSTKTFAGVTGTPVTITFNRKGSGDLVCFVIQKRNPQTATDINVTITSIKVALNP